uniref:SUMO-activating enzyme subunit 1 n=1 Tax=Heterorhabditis bacteriophora TaxID=37862 RepID=A0A1I7XMU0_HETBA
MLGLEIQTSSNRLDTLCESSPVPLRASSVLIYGLSGLGAEVTKNLMLCGLKAVVLMDERNVDTNDQLSNFLLAEDSLGKNRAVQSSQKAQALNPMVSFLVEECSIEDKNEKYIEQFSLVVFLDQNYDIVGKWNEKCRKLRIGFIAGSVFGWTGYSFFDFNRHLFLVKAEKRESAMLDVDRTIDPNEGMDTIEEDCYEKRILEYPSYTEAFNVDWTSKKLIKKSRRLLPFSYFPIKAILRAQQESKLTNSQQEDIASILEIWREEVLKCNHTEEDQSVNSDQFDYFFGPQLSAVCAIVGGIIGQEAIKNTGLLTPYLNSLTI